MEREIRMRVARCRGTGKGRKCSGMVFMGSGGVKHGCAWSGLTKVWCYSKETVASEGVEKDGLGIASLACNGDWRLVVGD